MKEMVGGCCVCADENGWAQNPLVYCDGPQCEVAVHQGCYGIIHVPEGDWLCDRCRSMKAQPTNATVPVCSLCPFGYGALKRTDKPGGWAHVICALYIPEVQFGNVDSMDPVVLSMIPEERFNKSCYLCEEQGNIDGRARAGACMQCNKQGCKKTFHVTCAQARGLLCEETGGGSSKNVKYCGYCAPHVRKVQNDPQVKVVPAYNPVKVRSGVTPFIDVALGATTGNHKNNRSGTSTPDALLGVGGTAIRDRRQNGPSSVHSNSSDSSTAHTKGGRSMSADHSMLLTNNSPNNPGNNPNSNPATATTAAAAAAVAGVTLMNSIVNRTLTTVAPVTAATAAVTSSTVYAPKLNGTTITSSATSGSQLGVFSTANLNGPPPVSSADAIATNNPGGMLLGGSSSSAAVPTTSMMMMPTNSLLVSGLSRPKTEVSSGQPLAPTAIVIPASSTAAVIPPTTIMGGGISFAATTSPTHHPPVKPPGTGKRGRPPGSGNRQHHHPSTDGDDPRGAAKRPRKNSKRTVKTLLELVNPVVQDTVSDFQRERVQQQGAAAAAAAAAAQQAPLHHHVVAPGGVLGPPPGGGVMAPSQPPPQQQQQQMMVDNMQMQQLQQSVASLSALRQLASPSAGGGGNPPPLPPSTVPGPFTPPQQSVSSVGGSAGLSSAVASLAAAAVSVLSSPNHSTTALHHPGAMHLQQTQTNNMEQHQHHSSGAGGNVAAPLPAIATLAGLFPDGGYGGGTSVAGGGSSFTSAGLPLKPTPKLGLLSPEQFCAASTSAAHLPLNAQGTAATATSHQGSVSFPTSLEQLLERQWEQGSQFLMEEAQHFDIASLLSCLHHLKVENQRLEDSIVQLAGRRDHLLAVNARLSLALGAAPPPSQSQGATPQSPHNSSHSPRVPPLPNNNNAAPQPPHTSHDATSLDSSPSSASAAALSQLRNLAGGNVQQTQSSAATAMSPATSQGPQGTAAKNPSSTAGQQQQQMQQQQATQSLAGSFLMPRPPTPLVGGTASAVVSQYPGALSQDQLMLLMHQQQQLAAYTSIMQHQQQQQQQSASPTRQQQTTATTTSAMTNTNQPLATAVVGTLQKNS